mmetsp:Transcript_99927/g.172350  ORF Transcript_99927/g.172350 Transcript_99927/m.172350 type:complete len:226 (+) Transcript_99927:120-797(+)
MQQGRQPGLLLGKGWRRTVLLRWFDGGGLVGGGVNLRCRYQRLRHVWCGIPVSLCVRVGGAVHIGPHPFLLPRVIVRFIGYVGVRITCRLAAVRAPALEPFVSELRHGWIVRLPQRTLPVCLVKVDAVAALMVHAVLLARVLRLIRLEGVQPHGLGHGDRVASPVNPLTILIIIHAFQVLVPFPVLGAVFGVRMLGVELLETIVASVIIGAPIVVFIRIIIPSAR